MPVIYILNKQNSLSQEPYATFDKKYKMVSEDLHGKELELPIGSDKKGKFSNGFYNSSYAYQKNRMMKFTFAKVNPNQMELEASQDCTFVRCTYLYEYEDWEFIDGELDRMKTFSLRKDYFYIPKAEYLEFSYKVDKELSINIDAIVLDPNDVQEVCHSMINQFIAIFSLDD